MARRCGLAVRALLGPLAALGLAACEAGGRDFTAWGLGRLDAPGQAPATRSAVARPGPEALPGGRLQAPPPAPGKAGLDDVAGPEDCVARLAALRERDGAGVALLWRDDRPRFGEGGGVVLDLDLPLAPSDRAEAERAPCVLVVAPAAAPALERRRLGQTSVASARILRTESAPNPAYEAAEARLRAAERERAGSDRRGIARTGDATADLVGSILSLVIQEAAAYRSARGRDEVARELEGIPRTLDRHETTPYSFSRRDLLLRWEAAFAVALLDREQGLVRRLRVPHVEERHLVVLDGLDPRDHQRDHHLAGAITADQLETLAASPIALPLSRIVDALVGASLRPEPAPPLAALLAGPEARPAGADTPSMPADPRLASVVTIEAGGQVGHGVFVAADRVLTTLGLIGRRNVVDVLTPAGVRVAALVAQRDPARDLALLQMPRHGPALALWSGVVPALGSAVELLDPGTPGGVAPGRLQAVALEPSPEAGREMRVIVTDALDHPRQAGSPLVKDDRLLGLGLWRLERGDGIAVHYEEIRAFLAAAPG